MKDRPPCMPFFVGNYLGAISVRLMTLAERGTYVHLLCLNWQDGRLQKAPKNLRNERQMLAVPCREWAAKMDGQIGLRPRTATAPSSPPIHPTGQTHIIPFIAV